MKVNVKKLNFLIYYAITMTILFIVLCLILCFKWVYITNYNIDNVVYQSSANVLEKSYIELCSTSSVKTYMDYRAITDELSLQYKYIQAYMKVNDKGLLIDKDGYIGVALGRYYGTIGSKYKITLDTGVILNVIKIEEKADNDTINGCQQKYDGSVIEFVIDTDYFELSDNGYIFNGNFNNNKDFNGNIESIEVI